MHALIHVATTLMQVVHSVPDTIVTKHVAGEPGIFQKVNIIAHAVVAAAVFLFAIAFLIIACYVRGIYLRISRLVDRLDGIVLQARGRIDQFNALLGVIQEEAESAFVEAAAAVRGVRTGLRQAFDHNEGDNDGDDDNVRAADAGPPRPGVKPRWNADEYE